MNTSTNLVRLEIAVYGNVAITRFTRTMPTTFLPKAGDKVQILKDSSLDAEVIRRRWDLQGIPVLHLQDIYKTPRMGYSGIIWSTTGKTGDPCTALLESGWKQITRD